VLEFFLAHNGLVVGTAAGARGRLIWQPTSTIERLVCGVAQDHRGLFLGVERALFTGEKPSLDGRRQGREPSGV
jgi:hypothetical protein